MWLKEALLAPPPGGNLVVAAYWLRMVALTLLCVSLGHQVDAVMAGRGIDAGWLAWAVAAVLVAAIAGAAGEAVPETIRAREEHGWRQRIIAAALGSIEPRSRAEVLELATASVERTANYRAGFLGPTCASWTSPVIVLAGAALLADWVWAGAMIGFVALVPLVIVVFGRRLRSSNSDYRRREAAETSRYLETLEGLGTLVAFGAAQRFRRALSDSMRATMHTLGRLLARNQVMIIVNDLVFSLAMLTAATALALWRLNSAAISPGQALSLVLVSLLLLEPIDLVGRKFYIGLGGRAHRERLDDYLASHGTGLPASELPATPVEAISLRHVSVRRGDKTLLDDVNLDIPVGAHVAVVGPSGAGKTTLVRLIAGLIQPDEGQVLVDARPASPSQLRSMVCLVSQHPGLTSTTIADNLRHGAPEASQQQMWAALELAGLDDEVRDMPDALATSIGQAGAHLSGGQCRRLALARAGLRDAPVLLLDEPTADLDQRTEQIVLDHLDDFTQARTSLVVAHKMATAARADLIVVVDDGRISAVGRAGEATLDQSWFSAAQQTEIGQRHG